MATPPKDDDGFVEPHDDRQTIPDNAYLIRYIIDGHLYPNPDGTRRLSTGAFSASSKARDRYLGMSADMLGHLDLQGVDPAQRMREGHVGAVKIQAGKLRSLGFQVGPDPTKANDPFHASVWGVKKRHRKDILDAAEWVIKPDDVV